jgi:hypothetical protein
MRTLKKSLKEIVATAAAGVLFLNSFTLVGAQEMEIIGNGSGSNNTEQTTVNNTTNVVQDNFADVENHINVTVSSGNNQAKGNTNGDVIIDTGAATANINVNNRLNANVAKVESCPGCPLDLTAEIRENGADSNNNIDVDLFDYVTVFQNNVAEVDNCVNAEVESGDNKVKHNTGGEIVIQTGPATANINLNTEANANVAVVKGGEDDNGTLEASIIGNGAESNNQIDIDLDRFVTLVQDNHARIRNQVWANVVSGENRVKYNTGGESVVLTGPATANVNVNNKANFNYAEADCCFVDEEDKIAENGANTNNNIVKDIFDNLNVFQNANGTETQNFNEVNGSLRFFTQIGVDPESGRNWVKYNTDPVEIDPFIVTGPATANVNTNNEGGVNLFNSDNPSWVPPVDFSFSLGEVLNFFLH